MLKKSVAISLLCFLFLCNSLLGFPAKDVQVITDRQYFGVVRNSIQKARSSIKVMMFEASYYEKHKNSPSNVLIRELIAAKKRGVGVTVILERREGKERATLRNVNTGNVLAQGGVEVVYDPLAITTHTKLLIIDGALSIVGSTNWTYNALDKNHEVSVLVQSPEVASNLQDYFQRVWKSCGKGK